MVMAEEYPPMRVLTLGETMVLLDGVEGGGFALGAPFRLRIAGAESNFAVALVRLGVPVTWISRLGSDPLGDLLYATLAAEGLDLGQVERDETAPTGLFFKWHEEERGRVLYRRTGSAASRLRPENVPTAAFEGVALVHLTGITMALSESARETVLAVAQDARARGITVTFDPNYRPALWEGPREAWKSQLEVLSCVDWYLCGEHESELLTGTRSPAGIREVVRAAGAREVAVRVGARGAWVWEGDEAVEVPPPRLEDVVDEIGAGDGFAAGFAYGLLQGWGQRACARAGNLIAAHALRGTGDWETFPYIADVRNDLTP
jgi:2-dehydro-3-deoxygluconokinase